MMLKANMSIKRNILIPMIILVALGCALVLIASIFLYNRDMTAASNQRLNVAITTLEYELNRNKNATFKVATELAENLELKNAIAAKNRDKLLEAANEIISLTEIGLCVITDSEGIVLARTLEPDMYGDSIISQYTIQSALRGEATTVIEPGAISRLSIRSGAPVYDEAMNIIGVILVGFRLDTFENASIIKNLTGCEVTFFLNDTRVATTVLASDGSYAVETVADENVSKKVLAGEPYFGIALVLGRDMRTIYMPLYGAENDIIGMVFVGEYMEGDQEKIRNFILYGALLMFVVLLSCIIIALFISGKIDLRLMNMMSKIREKDELINKAEEEHTASLKNILNGLDAMIYVTDPKTNEILFINDSMKKHYGLLTDPVGRFCYELLKKNVTKQCDFCPCKKLFNDPDAVVEWEEHSDLTNRIYRKLDRLIDWPDGRKVHLQNSEDITEKRLMEREAFEKNELLEEAVLAAEKATKAKSEFLSGMSHEMRTPMNAIIGMTAIGKKANDLEQKNQALNKIGDASSHLLGVINDILDMSKIEAGMFELASTQYNFENMIMRVFTVISFRADEKKQKISLDIDSRIPNYVEGDDQRLAQVIANLLSNAVKFTSEEGEISLNIFLIGEEDDICELRAEVTDNGIGISIEQQAKLFNAFVQAESGTNRNYGGTGLGLVISKNIIELMGGEIWIISELGKGAKFIFTVKVKRAYSEDENEINNKTGPGIIRNEFKNKTMLIVEDIEINREILMSLLEETGIDMECVENGKEALDVIAADPDKYDIIFMDLQMPEMDGFEATRRIRALPGHKPEKLPIVAMTANVFKDDIDACKAAGMDAHVGKPLDLDRILKKMRRFL